MTSFAFILGVLPLVVAQGAGAEMRRTLSTAVFAGMMGVTLFGIFLTPVFYSVVRWLSDRRPVQPASGTRPARPPPRQFWIRLSPRKKNMEKGEGTTALVTRVRQVAEIGATSEVAGCY